MYLQTEDNEISSQWYDHNFNAEICLHKLDYHKEFNPYI